MLCLVRREIRSPNNEMAVNTPKLKQSNCTEHVRCTRMLKAMERAKRLMRNKIET